MNDTCRWSDDGKDECGLSAIAEVYIKSETGTVKVPVCRRHKAVHNERAAAIRTKSKS